MKVYHSCECCGRIHKITEAEGPVGIAELHDLCPQCAEEIGVVNSNNQKTGQHFYN